VVVQELCYHKDSAENLRTLLSVGAGAGAEKRMEFAAVEASRRSAVGESKTHDGSLGKKVFVVDVGEMDFADAVVVVVANFQTRSIRP